MIEKISLNQTLNPSFSPQAPCVHKVYYLRPAMPVLFPRVDLVIPCYNPPADWPERVAGHFEAVGQALRDLTPNLRLIVVDDGSLPPIPQSVVTRLKARIPNLLWMSYPDNQGKGHALRVGVAAAQADFYIVTDADFPYTPESIRRVLEVLLKAGGIAAGNRRADYYAHVPPFRRWLSQNLRFWLRTVLRQPVDDSQCGLKGFDEAGKAIFLQTTIRRFLFDLEFLLLAAKQLNVTPVPVELRPGVVFSRVNWRILATEMGNLLWLAVVFVRRPSAP